MIDRLTLINIKEDLEKYGINFNSDDNNNNINDETYFDIYLKNKYIDIIVNKLGIDDKDKISALIVYLKYEFIYNMSRNGLNKIDLEFVELKFDENGYKTDGEIGSLCKVSPLNGKGNYYRWFVIIEKGKDRIKVMELDIYNGQSTTYPTYKYVVKKNANITEIKKHKKLDNNYVLISDIKKRNPRRMNTIIFDL